MSKVDSSSNRILPKDNKSDVTDIDNTEKPSDKKPISKKPEAKKSGGCCGKKKPAVPKKKLDPVAQKKQSKILMSIVGEQWPLLLLGAPFMFIGAIGEFAFPDFIGKIVNAMKDADADKIQELMIQWAVVIVVGALGAFCNAFIFGLVAERIGNSIRKQLFKKLVHLDTAFFDESRTGDLCKLQI